MRLRRLRFPFLLPNHIKTGRAVSSLLVLRFVCVLAALLSTSTQDTHSPHTAHKLHTHTHPTNPRPMAASGRRRLALPGTYRGLGARPHQGRARLVAADLGQMVLRRLDVDDGDVCRPRLWVRRRRGARGGGWVGGLVYHHDAYPRPPCRHASCGAPAP